MKKKIAVLLSALVVASTIAVPTAYVSAEDTGQTEANVTFEPGTLEFRDITGELNFSNSLNLYGEKINSDSPLNLSLLDQTGDLNGWNVKAVLGNFNSSLGPVMEGALINLSNGRANLDEEFEGTFTGAEVINATLSQNTEVELASAANADDPAATGMGPWNFEWTPELEYFQNTIHSANDDITGTITWTLTSNINEGSEDEGSEG